MIAKSGYFFAIALKIGQDTKCSPPRPSGNLSASKSFDTYSSIMSKLRCAFPNGNGISPASKYFTSSSSRSKYGLYSSRPIDTSRIRAGPKRDPGR